MSTTTMNADYDSSLFEQQYSSPSSHHDHQQQLASRCSLLFVQTSSLSSTCTGFGNCQEPAIWCWPQSCSFNTPDITPCSINGTSHSCICSSLPPTVQLGSEEISTTSALFSPTPETTQTSTWLSDTPTTTTPLSTTMSSWFSTSDNVLDSGSDFHQNGLGGPSTSSIGGQQGAENDGLPGGAIAAIVVVSFLVAVALIALSVWSVLKLKRKRKLEGKYCPAVEEQKSSANTLPPLPLPAPEGLI